MTGTRIAEVIEALVASLPASLPGVLVVDGLPVTGERIDAALVVGGSAVERDLPQTGQTSQTPHDMGGYAARDETGTVYCEAWAQSGGDDVVALRRRVVAIADAVADHLRRDPALGVDGMLRAEVAATQLIGPARTQSGTACRLGITVSYTALI